MSKYLPPYKIKSEAINLLSEISELVGRISAEKIFDKSPHLRKNNRIKSIQSSLAIENNSLSFDQVTDIINGKSVTGSSREIQEVKNAFKVYNLLETLNPFSEKVLFFIMDLNLSILFLMEMEEWDAFGRRLSFQNGKIFLCFFLLKI